MIEKFEILFTLNNYSLTQVPKTGIDQNASKGVVQYKVGQVSILLYPYPDDFEDIHTILNKGDSKEERDIRGTFIVEHNHRIINSKKSQEKYPNEATFIELDIEFDKVTS